MNSTPINLAAPPKTQFQHQLVQGARFAEAKRPPNPPDEAERWKTLLDSLLPERPIELHKQSDMVRLSRSYEPGEDGKGGPIWTKTYQKARQGDADKIDLSKVPLTGASPPAALHWYSPKSGDFDPGVNSVAGNQANEADPARAYAVWQDTGKSFIYVDTDGDGAANMKIQVSNVGRGDFIGVTANNGPVAVGDTNGVDVIVEAGGVNNAIGGAQVPTAPGAGVPAAPAVGGP